MTGDEKAMVDDEAMAITDQCTATAKSTGERCQQPAIDGGNVCRFHGGSTQHIKESAEARLERLARELLAELEPRIKDLLEQYDQAETVDEKVKTHRELRQAVTDVLDRTDHGPTETREMTGEDGGPMDVTIVREVVTDDD